MSIAFLQIKKYLLACDEFTIQNYQEICRLYGYTNVVGYFNMICSIVSDDELDLLLEKYHVYFEEEENRNMVEINNVFSNNGVPEVVMAYLNIIKGLEVLNPEVERALFTNLNRCLSKLKILEITNNLELKCDFATIFMSIYDERQIKLLTELVKASYTSNNGMIYEKVLALKDRKIIKKYLQLYQKKGEKLSSVEVATSIKEVDFSKYNNLSFEEFNEQLELLTQFLTIIKRIQLANLRLVVYVAKQYISWGHLLDFEDIIQEGNIGLMRAILKFDLSKTRKFSTYAVLWITQFIRGAIIDKAYTIRKPRAFDAKYKQYKRVVDMYKIRDGRMPTIAEIAEELNISPEKCIEIKRLAREPIPFEQAHDEDDDSSNLIANKIVDSTILTVEEEFEQKELREQLEALLSSTLNKKELDIIRLHYGFDDGIERSLVEIGKKYNVSKQAINQMEMKAFKKIRESNKRNYLSGYISNL